MSDEKEEVVPDIRSELEKAFEADGSDEAPEEVVETVEEDEVLDEPEVVEAEPEDGAIEEISEVEDDNPEPEAVEAHPIKAPVSWTAENKEKFLELPADMQEYIVEREKQRETFLHQKSEEASHAKRQWDELNQVIEPYKQSLQLDGENPAQAVQRLLAAEDYLARDPLAALQYLANSYGVTLSELAQAQPTTQVDPQLNHLNGQVQQLQSQLAQTQQQTQQQHIGAIEADIQMFREETNGNGQPLRPHFADVEADMEPIVRHLRAQKPNASNHEILAESYERAVRANPYTYKLLEKEREAKSQAKLDSEKKKKIASAKKAGKSITGQATGAISQDAPDSVRAALEQAFDIA